MALTKNSLKKENTSTANTLPKVQGQFSFIRQFSYRWQQAKRVFYAFFPAFLQANDAWAKDTLSPIEFELYAQMDIRDRHHACKVAELLLK